MFKRILKRIIKKKNGKYRKSAISLMAMVLAMILSETLGVNIGQDQIIEILSHLLND